MASCPALSGSQRSPGPSVSETEVGAEEGRRVFEAGCPRDSRHQPFPRLLVPTQSPGQGGEGKLAQDWRRLWVAEQRALADSPQFLALGTGENRASCRRLRPSGRAPHAGRPTARKARLSLQGKKLVAHLLAFPNLVPTKEVCNSEKVFKSNTSTSCLTKGLAQPLPCKGRASLPCPPVPPPHQLSVLLREQLVLQSFHCPQNPPYMITGSDLFQPKHEALVIIIQVHFRLELPGSRALFKGICAGESALLHKQPSAPMDTPEGTLARCQAKGRPLPPSSTSALPASSQPGTPTLGLPLLQPRQTLGWGCVLLISNCTHRTCANGDGKQCHPCKGLAAACPDLFHRTSPGMLCRPSA